ncbi:hypothetical protein Patl1_25458 [Pistacia atlantica]|uniref:Uncharacterized protein n=1 Tax=Pistacia atlantica TaxID=434234 RepID=A0ACC1B0W3_9ROSI|nr:hypothetical protein Patl1_25458 [Pistacia atlantica]
MFLVALARPRFDAQGRTLETKPITSVKREVIRSFLLEKVLPAIKANWPREDFKYPKFIQQDNARTHINHNNDEFCQLATQDGFDIRLMCQPANSPDLNVLDLGFFSAIQSLQSKESPKTVDELVNAVVNSFEAFSIVMSNYIFLTLQMCLIEIMRAKGSRKYKIPHVKKAMLESEGQLPT